MSASVAGGKLLASGNFEAARCPKGFTVAPDAGEVVSIATADGVKVLPSNVDDLDGVKLETVEGAPYTKEGELPVDALRANVLYATEKKLVDAAGSARDEDSEKSESPAKKDASAPSRVEVAGRKDSIAPRLPQTGDANLTPPLVFAGIIGVALLGAGIALLFDKRK